ncbi:MAG: SDR family NAD(P)-dependent oxidoreductase [Prosthecobacter sp.]|uniref:SDR family NAD(P)-dependent oxidoreductase n=1 Tax=Prosthecobacter sp. TaxID=1965333 RepID=UPI003BB13DB7
MKPVILITGATRGIGFAAARQLAARGAKVIIASRDGKRAAEAAVLVGDGACGVALDITDQASVEAAVKQIEQQFGRLDVLANNSAILLDHYQSLLQLKPEMLLETLNTNVVGTLRACQAFAPLLAKSSAPRIINVSSGAGQLDGEPQSWAPAYCISKTALNMLTQQLTAALPDVMVNSMCPGWCRTEMGGSEAPRTPDEGADTLTWLALDAPHALRGKFVKDRAVISW